jgi:microcystin-dependent protein
MPADLAAQPTPPTWAWYLAQPTGQTVAALAAATARKLSFYLDAAATAAFTMPGAHPETAQVEELGSDMLAVRNGVSLFRGRVGGSTDTLTADADTVAFTAVDYRGMLDRRILWPEVTRSFRGEDQADIAWQMIADTQGLAGGGLGITRGNAPDTGVLRDRDYDPGKSVGEALTQLGQCLDGFNWEIDANRRFNLYYPQRGAQVDQVLLYGRDIVGLTRTTVPANYANAVYYTGGPLTTPDEAVLSAFDAEIGRWDAQKSDPNLILQDTVDQQSAAELDNASTFDPAYAVTMAAGAWDPATLWLGDTVRLVVTAGRLDVDTTRRVIGIDIVLDDAGGEVVTISVADAIPLLTTRLQSYNSRLNNLERGLGYVPDAPVGTMFDWPGSAPPQLYLWADGTVLNQAAYPELFSVIGTTYGAGGAGTFALPDCRGRFTLAASSTHAAASTGGAETVALTQTQMAGHIHQVNLGSSVTDNNHTHNVSLTSAEESANHAHPVSITTGNQNADHTHNLGYSATASVPQGAYAGAVMTPGPSTTTGTSAGHGHAVNGNTGIESVPHAHAISGASAGQNADHHHSVTGPTDAGTGTSVAHENMPPYLVIGKVIKAVSAQNAALVGATP